MTLPEIEFVARMVQIGFDAVEIKDILSIGMKYRRLMETGCEREFTTRETMVRNNLEWLLSQYAMTHTVAIVCSGDPRGHTITVVLDGNSFGVPTS